FARPRTVEIRRPWVSHSSRCFNERRCAPVEFRHAPDEYRTARAVQWPDEVEIGFDRQEVRQHVGPGPFWYGPPVEVLRDRPTEVTAVDGPGTTHNRTAHHVAGPDG